MTTVQSKPITLVLAVVVTCVVAAAGLAATYAVTKDRIAEQDRLAIRRRRGQRHSQHVVEKQFIQLVDVLGLGLQEEPQRRERRQADTGL